MTGFEKFKVKVERARAKKSLRVEVVSDSAVIEKIKSKANSARNIQSNEMNRITSLPVVLPMTPEEHEEFNKERLLSQAYDSGFRLFDTQSNGLRAYEKYGGLFAPIGVGWGKTLLSLMIANAGFAKGIKKMMLMVPPEVMGQLVNTDIRFARRHVPITYPIHIMGGRSLKARRQIASSDRHGLYVFPYSLLSTKDTDENLNDISPGLLIGDEAHRIANRTAARTRRMTSYIEEQKPECVFLSGTITSKGVRDYHHLIRSALSSNCPLPMAVALAQEWGQIIDSEQVDWSTNPDNNEVANPALLMPLVDWARATFPQSNITGAAKDEFRTAYRLRLTHCPGVVSSGEADIGTSLAFKNKPIENYRESPNWDDLSLLIKKVEDEWTTPNGDQIEHAFHAWKWLYELSSGFYNNLVWPSPEIFAKRRGIEIEEADEILYKAKDYHDYQQIYAKELRNWIQEYARPSLDTPLLIGLNMSQHGADNVGNDLYETWMEMKERDFEGRPDRDSHAVRVCPFKVDAAADWAQNISGGAILWVHHQEIGRWTYDTLQARGVDAIYCPAGPEHNERILEENNRGKKIVASITAHGTGKNLQAFQNQCFVQWPRSARVAEQTLGRLHRNGQTADEIEAITFNTLLFDNLNLAACLNDSLYIHQSTGVRQKMIYGAYEPSPKIFPPAVLKERGAEGVKMLTPEMQAIMNERFG